MAEAGNSSNHRLRISRFGSRYLWLLGAVGAIVLAAAAVIVVAAVSKPSVALSTESLAGVRLPFGGGKIERVVVLGTPEQSVIPVDLRGDEIYPTGKIRSGERLKVEVTIKRPGWVSWLSGKTERVVLSETTPVAKLVAHYLTRRAGQPLTVDFRQPVARLAYGTSRSQLKAISSSGPVRALSLNDTATAGALLISAASRSWEKPTYTTVTWFPAGAKATVVASPAPGSAITPTTDITFTFSRPVKKVLGSSMPPVSPRTDGTWHQINGHTIEFEPEQYGYGLGADVSISLPAGVQLVGGSSAGSDPVGTWTVHQGSVTRLQQLLAELGYLPVSFQQSGTAVANTIPAQETAALDPPSGTFSWRYPNTPSALKTLWQPGAWDEVTKGAVMAFEEASGLTPDGIPGPAVWQSLIQAAIQNKDSSFGYTYVHVTETLPETITVWHSGKVVVQGLANTGIPASPTALGVFAVYEHIPVGTMSGTNPNGTPYHDTGIPWISYFNGGDALHGFIRASYGFPQSLGCVEMPFSEAAEVYPYTPIGTIVNVVA